MSCRYAKESLLAAVLIFSTIGTNAAMAGTLIGSGSLNSPDDLTLIEDDSGNVLEFLDVSITAGLTVEQALIEHSPDGFRWANGAEVSELFDAFNIIYSNFPSQLTEIDADISDITNFVSYLGETAPVAWPGSTLGYIDDLITQTVHTYSCIGESCLPFDPLFDAFVTNTTSYPAPNEDIGVFLVRDGEGGGTIPDATLNPTSLDFGDQLIGTTSASQVVTLTVTGTEEVDDISINVSGDFTRRSRCNSVEDAGESCTIEVSFAPTSLGALNGTLTVTSDASSSPDIVTLSGNGISETVPPEPAKPIPTLSEWAMILLVLMLAGAGFLFGRSRLG